MFSIGFLAGLFIGMLLVIAVIGGIALHVYAHLNSPDLDI